MLMNKVFFLHSVCCTFILGLEMHQKFNRALKLLAYSCDGEFLDEHLRYGK